MSSLCYILRYNLGRDEGRQIPELPPKFGWALFGVYRNIVLLIALVMMLSNHMYTFIVWLVAILRLQFPLVSYE
jgi:hypothetical protein